MMRGSEAGLELTHAQTGTVFADDALVDRNTAVLVRRVPIHHRAPIVSQRGQDTEINIADAPASEKAPSAAAETAPPQAETAPAPAAAPAPAEPKQVSAGYAAKLICPLTRQRYVEAVIVTCCGTSFSKQQVMLALQATGRCPHCAKPAAQVKVLKNASLRKESF